MDGRSRRERPMQSRPSSSSLQNPWAQPTSGLTPNSTRHSGRVASRAYHIGFGSSLNVRRGDIHSYLDGTHSAFGHLYRQAQRRRGRQGETLHLRQPCTSNIFQGMTFYLPAHLCRFFTLFHESGSANHGRRRRVIYGFSLRIDRMPFYVVYCCNPMMSSRTDLPSSTREAVSAGKVSASPAWTADYQL